MPVLVSTLASSRDDAQDVPPVHLPAPGLSRARQSKDQKPQIHLHTARQPPSITCRYFSPFLTISWAVASQPKRCLLLAKSHQQNQDLNRNKPHLERDKRRRCAISLPRTQTHVYSRMVLGRGDPVFFTQTLRALDTEKM